MPLSRRAFLAAAAVLGWSPPLLAAQPSPRRLVVIVLRGGMDGLHAVPPLGDSAYEPARRGLALADSAQAPRLDGLFALHPALAPLLPLWRAGELAAVHAVASPYRERSHFDAQDMLESGATRPHLLSDGWLNRAARLLGSPSALAVGQALPLLLRGPAAAASWAPSPLPGLPPALQARLREMYAGDRLLAGAFEEGVQMEAFAAEAMVAGGDETMAAGRKASTAFPTLAGLAGGLMAAADGPRLVVLELGGWDTHSGQMGRMAAPLGRLAEGILTLSRALGPAWTETVVVAASEFGRTVAANGTGGSDHGTGGAVLLAGGALAGGRVIADWPGLGPAELHQGRDLRPTTDLRAVFKGLLRDHLSLPAKALGDTVFPDSAALRPLDGLIRA